MIDGDKFDESNLNRQLFATEKNIGYFKAEIAKERLSIVNSNVEYIIHSIFIDESNADKLLSSADIIIDAFG